MGDGEYGGFDHIRVAQQRLFHLAGRDLLPAAVDDLFDAADDEKISLLVQVAEVAGSKPAVPKSFPGRGGIIVVSPRDGGTAQRNLAPLARRKPSARGV